MARTRWRTRRWVSRGKKGNAGRHSLPGVESRRHLRGNYSACDYDSVVRFRELREASGRTIRNSLLHEVGSLIGARNGARTSCPPARATRSYLFHKNDEERTTDASLPTL